jgi:hypothetical protein
LEFHESLDKAIDEADQMLRKFVQAIAFQKSGDLVAKEGVCIGRNDVRLVDTALREVYQELRALPEGEKSKQIRRYDLAQAWLMELWARLLNDDSSTDLLELSDSMRQTLSDGRSRLEDAFQELKNKLKNIECNWQESPDLTGRITQVLPHHDDAIHVSMVAAFCQRDGVPGFFVTNDGPLLGCKDEVYGQFGVRLTGPAFAFPYYIGMLPQPTTKDPVRKETPSVIP